MLKALREKAGLSISRLAKNAGVTQPYLSRLESGEQEPGWIAVLKIAHALGVGIEVFDPTRKA